MLSIKDLSLFHRQGNGNTLISNLSFDLHSGEILGMVGASGSGKSLIASFIQGYLPAGFSYLGSVSCSADSPRTTALIPQNSAALNPSVRIGQQLKLFAAPGVDILSLWQHVKLPESLLTHYPHQLSGGETKRVLSLLALVQDTPFILADEPSCGLDEGNALLLLQLYREIAQQGKGILVISHDLSLLMRAADRLLILKDGQAIECNTTDNIRRGHCHPYTQSLWQAEPQNWDFI